MSPILRHPRMLWLVGAILLGGCAAREYPRPAGDSERQRLMARGHVVYRQACASCHDTGAGGAQVIGDRQGWRSRLEKGPDLLVKRSILGFRGAVGYMPPRGGVPALSDRQVAAAVFYLVETSR